jgi:glucokinase
VILAGDVGGTRARLALYAPAEGKAAGGGKPKGKPVKQAVFESRAYRSLEAVVQEFLGPKLAGRVAVATFGIAGPVVDQRCVATNLPWVVDARVVARKLGIGRVTLLNDLVALAFGALTVPPSKIRVLHGSAAPRKKGGNLAVIAAGTGLGEAGLVWDGAAHVPLATEGGHVDFAPRGRIEWELLSWLEKRFGHVSYERIVAGPGFSNLYDFLVGEKRMRESRANAELLAKAADRNAAIAKLGLARKSEPAARAIELFARIYGAEAGNLALKTFATAGVFVAGGIAANMVTALARGPFVRAFLDKGRFRGFLEAIPVAVVLDADIGLAGSRYHAAHVAPG